MRLAYVIDSLVGSGGAEQSLLLLAREWVRQGYELSVVELSGAPGLHDDFRTAGADVRTIGGRADATVLRLQRVLRILRPDLVHTTLFRADVLGRVAAAAAAVPSVSTLASESYGPAHYGDPRLRRSRLAAAQALDAATARHARRLHAVSEAVARQTGGALRYPSHRITVIPRGRDSTLLGRRSVARRRAVRRSLGLSDKVPVVLAAARHEQAKGLDVLLRALAQRSAPDGAVVLLAGREGGETQHLRALAARVPAEVHVRFLGYRKDIADLMCAADVVVIPSRREGSPGTLLEAFALECCVVASDIDAVREVVTKPGAALLFPQGEVGRLADQLHLALTDGPLRRRAGALGGEVFRSRYELRRVAAEMMDFHRQALQ